jgi:beta-N-acetylhexosaminidase
MLALRMAAFAVSLLLFAVLAPATIPAIGPGAVRRSLPEEPASRSPVDQGTHVAVPGCSKDPLTLRERIGQTIMVNVPGTEASETVASVAGVAGAVVLQGHNVTGPDQLAALTAALHRAGRHRLLVAVGEEGGRVSRLGEEGLVSHLPSARRLAAERSVEEVRALGEALGERMRELGLDWNLAPVLDVTSAPAGSVIGDRSYGDDAATVSAYGRAFAQGLAAGGVLTTGKHFPGHGATAVDSHQTLPVVDISTDSLEEHVLPYRDALPALDSVMTANVLFSALDPDRPASLSPAAVLFLRGELGFPGVVITDALEMDAITEGWTVPQAAELALGAGADMVLLGSWTFLAPTMQRLGQAVRSDRLPATRLDQAVGRILAMKGYPAGTIDCMLA